MGRHKSDLFRCANTRHLTRILTVLKTRRNPLIKKELENTTGINNDIVTDALQWLINHKLVKTKRTRQTGRIYFIE